MHKDEKISVKQQTYSRNGVKFQTVVFEGLHFGIIYVPSYCKYYHVTLEEFPIEYEIVHVESKEAIHDLSPALVLAAHALIEEEPSSPFVHQPSENKQARSKEEQEEEEADFVDAFSKKASLSSSSSCSLPLPIPPSITSSKYLPLPPLPTSVLSTPSLVPSSILSPTLSSDDDDEDEKNMPLSPQEKDDIFHFLRLLASQQPNPTDWSIMVMSDQFERFKNEEQVLRKTRDVARQLSYDVCVTKRDETLLPEKKHQMKWIMKQLNLNVEERKVLKQVFKQCYHRILVIGHCFGKRVYYTRGQVLYASNGELLMETEAGPYNLESSESEISSFFALFEEQVRIDTTIDPFQITDLSPPEQCSSPRLRESLKYNRQVSEKTIEVEKKLETKLIPVWKLREAHKEKQQRHQQNKRRESIEQKLGQKLIQIEQPEQLKPSNQYDRIVYHDAHSASSSSSPLTMFSSSSSSPLPTSSTFSGSRSYYSIHTSPLPRSEALSLQNGDSPSDSSPTTFLTTISSLSSYLTRSPSSAVFSSSSSSSSFSHPYASSFSSPALLSHSKSFSNIEEQHPFPDTRATKREGRKNRHQTTATRSKSIFSFGFRSRTKK